MASGLNRRSSRTEEALAERYRAALRAAGFPADEAELLLARYGEEEAAPSSGTWKWEEELRRQKRMNLPRDDSLGFEAELLRAESLSPARGGEDDLGWAGF